MSRLLCSSEVYEKNRVAVSLANIISRECIRALGEKLRRRPAVFPLAFWPLFPSVVGEGIQGSQF